MYYSKFWINCFNNPNLKKINVFHWSNDNQKKFFITKTPFEKNIQIFLSIKMLYIEQIQF